MFQRLETCAMPSLLAYVSYRHLPGQNGPVFFFRSLGKYGKWSGSGVIMFIHLRGCDVYSSCAAITRPGWRYPGKPKSGTCHQRYPTMCSERAARELKVGTVDGRRSVDRLQKWLSPIFYGRGALIAGPLLANVQFCVIQLMATAITPFLSSLARLHVHLCLAVLPPLLLQALQVLSLPC